jgi:phosphoglycolate phosphatase (TIGR01487 family)
LLLAQLGVRGIALDVDGTMTVSRSSYLIDLELARMLRGLEEAGVRVMLVTGNALPVVVGLARYMGFRGPHVAENGCLVFHEGRVVEVCRVSCLEAARAVGEELAEMLEPSWQNRYRSFDYAFRVKEAYEPTEVANRVESLLRSRGHPCKVAYSGYAIHLRPPEASKGAGLARALELAGLKPSEVIAIGDSAIDVEMAEAGVELYAVGNAEEELKSVAKRVLPGSSAEAVKSLLRELGV